MGDDTLSAARAIKPLENGYYKPPQFKSPESPKSLEVKKFHVGPIHSHVAGRTDHLPMHVPSGSYVLPADIVSGMGEGNTLNGFKNSRLMFSGLPYGGNRSGGPYGQGAIPYQAKAGGGAVDQGVPIVAAGGEYVVAPHEVIAAGDGDKELGHRVLDEFVKRMRDKTIKTLKNLPGPRRN